MIQRACGAAGFLPAIRARSSDFSVLTALVAAGAGVALAPRMASTSTSTSTSTSVSLHPLRTPVTRNVFHVVRGAAVRRYDLGHVIDLLELAAAALA